jgi:hypothetical protein
MNFSKELKDSINKSTLGYIKEKGVKSSEFRVYASAIVFKTSTDGSSNPNFNENSLRHISKNQDWKNRLTKRHTHFKDDTLEMESSNSSDALLMNIFCHPKFSTWKGPHSILGFAKEQPKFGVNPGIENHNSPSEIDMILGDVIYEAKLTETDFTTKDLQTVLRVYPEMEDVFDLEYLSEGDSVKHYQLLRNIYAVHRSETINEFKLLLDYRRPDLLHCLLDVIKTIRNDELRRKCGFITWQQIARTVGQDLKDFLRLKYGI